MWICLQVDQYLFSPSSICYFSWFLISPCFPMFYDIQHYSVLAETLSVGFLWDPVWEHRTQWGCACHWDPGRLCYTRTTLKEFTRLECLYHTDKVNPNPKSMWGPAVDFPFQRKQIVPVERVKLQLTSVFDSLRSEMGWWFFILTYLKL